MKKYISIILFNALIFNVLKINAQVIPTPAANQSETILIMNAKAHIGNGKVIENSVIGLENGKIILIADATTVRIDGSKYKKTVNASGKHVYPSLIAPNTPLGLLEIQSIRASVDLTEIGVMNPSVRSIVAYNTDSQVPPTVRSNGILLAQIVPQGGTISGQSSIVELDAWNWEDAGYKVDNGMHLRWPGLYSVAFDFASSNISVKKNEKYNTELNEIDAFFKEAQAYTKKSNPLPKNLKLEAMQGVFNDKKTLFVHCNLAKEITEAVLFGKKYGCKTVIVGGKDAWMVADFLKANNTAVVLSQTQDLPSRNDDDIDQPFKTPAMLKAAGVQFCMSVGGGWQTRNLPLMAGQAVGFGLAYEDAITSMTSDAAKILGIDATVGTLEEGKDATLIIAEGDILDMRTSKVTQAFIRGKEIDLDNKGKQLYRRFQTKYDRQGKK
jgi:imidazolonepropionase-like amidohydrolase